MNCIFDEYFITEGDKLCDNEYKCDECIKHEAVKRKVYEVLLSRETKKDRS